MVRVDEILLRPQSLRNLFMARSGSLPDLLFTPYQAEPSVSVQTDISMRYAVLADIHANIEALTAVLSEVDRQGVDKIVCAGDLVGYYANPNECLDLIQKRQIDCVAGNHDRGARGDKAMRRSWEWARRAIVWTQKTLTQENHAFLNQLPLVRSVDNQFLLVHAALHPEPNEETYLTQEDRVLESFEALRQDHAPLRVCFFGHTHHPVVYAYRDGRLFSEVNHAVILAPDACYLINPGSVGQSRDDDPRASFLLFDAKEQQIAFHRVSYDIKTPYRKAKAVGILYQEGQMHQFLDRSMTRVVTFFKKSRLLTRIVRGMKSRARSLRARKREEGRHAD